MPGRAPQNPAKIPLRAVGKLSVKDKVISNQKQRLAGICLSEMQQVFLCFKNYSFNEEACASEIKLFQACYNQHLEVVQKKKVKESKKATSEEVNKLLRSYPERINKFK